MDFKEYVELDEMNTSSERAYTGNRSTQRIRRGNSGSQRQRTGNQATQQRTFGSEGTQRVTQGNISTAAKRGRKLKRVGSNYDITNKQQVGIG
tara:strand:- start:196 stop:474 length:279 start_codon:yes stop_codon:yes gene_type:complete